MKTLADMTEKERAECVGMWCGYNRHVKGGEPSDFIIMVEDVNEAGRVPCVNPGAPEPKAWAPDPWMITPRPDLPRAWTPNGQRPVGEWEYDYVGTDGCSMITGEYVDPKPGEKIRRWVGDWETAEEEA